MAASIISRGSWYGSHLLEEKDRTEGTSIASHAKGGIILGLKKGSVPLNSRYGEKTPHHSFERGGEAPH